MLKDIRNRRDFGLNNGKQTEEILDWMVAKEQGRFWTEWWQTNRRDFGL